MLALYVTAVFVSDNEETGIADQHSKIILKESNSFLYSDCMT